MPPRPESTNLPERSPSSKLPPAPGELALIERIRRRAATLPLTPELTPGMGIGDDCAILRPGPGEDLTVTTDFCLEGRHWSRAWNPPASAGHRTLARGLSDLAAMGARPVAAFLSLALPAETARDTPWLDGFLDGLLALAGRHGIPLAGGDTSESPSPHVLADIVCLGAVPHGTALRRSGARPGDALYCTGALGGSFAERTTLAALAADSSPAPARRGRPADQPAAQSAAQLTAHPFLYPEPRLAAGQALRERQIATACIDLSDGLSTDLQHLCEASGTGAEIDLRSLPASAHLRRLRRPPRGSGDGEGEQLHAMLHGGEDYELLFTASPATRLPARLSGVRLTRIGTILRRPRSGPALFTLSPAGRRQPLEPQGWEHLR